MKLAFGPFLVGGFGGLLGFQQNFLGTVGPRSRQWVYIPTGGGGPKLWFKSGTVEVWTACLEGIQGRFDATRSDRKIGGIGRVFGYKKHWGVTNGKGGGAFFL